jgi:hypothetical protein
MLIDAKIYATARRVINSAGHQYYTLRSVERIERPAIAPKDTTCKFLADPVSKRRSGSGYTQSKSGLREHLKRTIDADFDCHALGLRRQGSEVRLWPKQA